MKKILFVCMVLLLSISAKAIDKEALVKNGNEAYKKGNYEQAITNYEQVIGSGYEAAELYFNLGNSYYKSNKYTLAILNYERAKRLAPTDEDIKFNLDVANRHSVDKIEAIPQLFVKEWFDSFVSSFHTNTWAVISVICFIAFLIAISFFLLSQKVGLKKLGFGLGIFLLLISITSFSFSYQQYDDLVYHNEAILFNPTVNVKSEPNDKSTNLFILHEGTKVLVIESSGEWSQIKLSDGKIGWIKSADITMI